MVVPPSPRPCWPLKKRSCLISANAGGVGYCTLTPTLFFNSALGLGVRLTSDEDTSLRSGVGHESDHVRVCPADQGVLDGDPACRRPASGSGMLQSASAAVQTSWVVMSLLLQDIASSGDGTRLAILKVVTAQCYASSPEDTRRWTQFREH